MNFVNPEIIDDRFYLQQVPLCGSFNRWSMLRIWNSNTDLPWKMSIALVFEREYKESITLTTVRRLLKQYGYAIRKARKVLTSPDPDYREKVDLMLRTLQNLKPGELFLFVDELGPLRVKKYGGHAWVQKNEALTYPQVQAHRGVIMMSGALRRKTCRQSRTSNVFGNA